MLYSLSCWAVRTLGLHLLIAAPALCWGQPGALELHFSCGTATRPSKHTISLAASRHRWVPLPLDVVRPDSQERPGSRTSSRCQPDANKTPHSARRNDARSESCPPTNHPQWRCLHPLMSYADLWLTRARARAAQNMQ